MKTFKTSLLSLFIAASMGAVSTSALAESDPGRVTYKPAEAIDMVTAKIQAAIEGISKGASGDEAAALIKPAIDLSKEINANDKLDRNRNRANDYLKKARVAVQNGDLAKATEDLKEAEKRFSDLKGMIDLTLDDRESQQTHMLNRILDTPDPKAGSRK